MQEATFQSRYAGYTLQYDVTKVKVGARKEVDKVLKVAFEGGRYTTSDENIINMLREEIELQKKHRGRPDFFEITAQDQKEVSKAQERLAESNGKPSAAFKK